MIRKSAIATTTLLLLSLTVPLGWAQERAIRPLETNNKQALVIGNGNYVHAGVLRNPANDAKAIGRTLEQLGFKVTTLTDADERQMDQAIRNFGRQLRGSNGVGLFYYAGHGMQIEGQNYLLPTDINPSNEFDVTYDAVPVGKLLGQMQVAENGMNIVILDACRNNPFARSFRSSSRGLAQVIAPTGSFISYATAPGNVAADGEGDNGLFTEKLLQHMTTPGLRLEEVFKRVRADVQQDSNNKQVPWDSSSLTGDFFFVPNAEVASAAPTVISSGTTPEQDFAAQAWALIKDSEDRKAFEEYIEMFPEVPQSKLAKLKLITLPTTSSKDIPTNVPLINTETVLEEPAALAGADAIKKMFRSNECRGCDFRGTNLRKVNYTGADLRSTDFRGVDLSHANLSEADLRGADLRKAILNANFYQADLRQANLDGSVSFNPFGAKFCNTTMVDGSINNNDCEKGDQASPEVGVVLSGEAAKKKLLETKECTNCDLRGANLREADLSGASLYRADLSGADLSGASLVLANLIEANLNLANLIEANLREANLREADLSGASLYRADLSGADLSGAKLYKADLSGAKFCNTTMPDGSINNSDC